MTRIGDVGTARLIDWDVKASFYVSLALMKTNNKVDSKFLAYQINSYEFIREIWGKTLHVAFPNKINLGDISKCKIVHPPLPEQKRIVKVLEAWDEVIVKLTRKIEIKKNIKKGLMQRLLTPPKGGQAPKVRLPGFTEPWQKLKLGECIKSVSSRNRDLKINRVLSVTNKNGFVLPADRFARVVASDDLSNYKIVRKGQFAYNPSRINVGSIARLDSYDEGALSPMYIVFKIENCLNSDFLNHWLKTGEANSRIRNMASGSVRETVDFKSLSLIKITLPGREEQDKIAEVLNVSNSEINILENKLNKLINQKKYLLNNLVTGRIRVPEKV